MTIEMKVQSGAGYEVWCFDDVESYLFTVHMEQINGMATPILTDDNGDQFQGSLVDYQSFSSPGESVEKPDVAQS